MKKTISIIGIVLLLFSCKEVKNEGAQKESVSPQKELAVQLKSVELTIEGMTCEIGCARLIESKLSKVTGIAYIAVDFEAKKGTCTFDTNKLTSQDIVLNISTIADGTLYSVSNIAELEEVITKENVED